MLRYDDSGIRKIISERRNNSAIIKRRKSNSQATDTENRHQLYLHSLAHLQTPNRRQRGNKKHEIRKDVHSSQDHEDDIDLGALRLDKGILFALNGPALEDDADDLDAAVFCHDKAGGP